jgi:Protein of unknown function (DUF3396)
VQLNVDAAADDLGALGYRWFDEMSQRLAPQVRQELADLPARVARSKVRFGPLGEPGSVFGVVDVYRLPGRGEERNCSTAGMRWLRDQFAQQLPWRAHLWFGRLDERGHRSGALLWLEMRHDEESSGWVRLSGYPLENDFLDPQTGPAEQQRWREALYSFADGLNPGYGHIAYAEEGATALERGFDPRQYPPEWRYPHFTVNDCRRYLRGYSWLTIVSQELAQRLGGVDGLRATGAFCEVRQLSRGGVWLQTTPDYRDFTDEALARAFHAVAPVLRPGMPRQVPQMSGEPPQRIVFQDAAKVGRSS